jgi:hypothetical protein
MLPLLEYLHRPLGVRFLGWGLPVGLLRPGAAAVSIAHVELLVTIRYVHSFQRLGGLPWSGTYPGHAYIQHVCLSQTPKCSPT